MTWKDNIVDVLDSNLNVIETMAMFEGVREGWGVTRDGKTLYISNGSNTLTKINAETFENQGMVEVTEAGKPVS